MRETDKQRKIREKLIKEKKIDIIKKINISEFSFIERLRFKIFIIKHVHPIMKLTLLTTWITTAIILYYLVSFLWWWTRLWVWKVI